MRTACPCLQCTVVGAAATSLQIMGLIRGVENIEGFYRNRLVGVVQDIAIDAGGPRFDSRAG